MDEDRDSVDERLDRELERVLDVRPSAAFAARVRARVAAQPSGWELWLPWRIAAVAVCAVLAVWAWSVPWTDADVHPVARQEQPAATPAVPLPSAALTLPRPDVPDTIEPAPRPGRRERRVAAERLDQVLVSRDESDAIRTLLESMSDGRIAPPVFLDAAWGSGDSSAAIEIPLLAELAPLSLAPISEGVSQ